MATLSYDSSYNLCQFNTGDGLSSTWLHDGWGRRVKATDARGNVQWKSYDLLGRILEVHEPDGNRRQLRYDGLDNVIWAKDRQHEINYSYQGTEVLLRRVEAGVAFEYVYDAEQQLRALVNEKGLFYRFGLDSEGDVIAETGFDGLTQHYTRDIAGRVVETSMPSGETIKYGYDQVERLTEVVYSDGARSTFAYRADGALLESRNNTCHTIFERDIVGKVLREYQNEHWVECGYDGAGQRISLHSSLGASIEYRRNSSGQVEKMLANNQWQAHFERDVEGLEQWRALSGGVKMAWKRDSLGRPVRQRISTGEKMTRERAYHWHSDNRLFGLEDTLQGSTRFMHDEFGSLIQATHQAAREELRLPDAVGNFYQDLGKKKRSFGTGGQLLADEGKLYAYDQAGRRTRKITPEGQEWHYQWNSAGMLESVLNPQGQLIQFTYDALGRRISKDSQGKRTRWVWNGAQPLHEWNEQSADAATDVVTWLFEENSHVPIVKLTQVTAHSILTDHLALLWQVNRSVVDPTPRPPPQKERGSQQT